MAAAGTTRVRKMRLNLVCQKRIPALTQCWVFARHAAPWIAITLADASYEQRGVQVIAAQPAADKDEVWVTVITKETDRKEIPGNV